MSVGRPVKRSPRRATGRAPAETRRRPPSSATSPAAPLEISSAVTWGLLALILVGAAVLRLWRPDWYLDRQFHPDERWLFQVTAALTYPDAPERLQYGTLPLYLLATLRQVAEIFTERLDVGRFLMVGGRTLTGLLDTATVAATFLLGRAAFGGLVGLAAGAFAAVTVLHVQLAHSFAVDVPASLAVTLTLLACVRISRGPNLAASLAAGIGWGLALACKSSILPLALPLAVAHFVAPSPERRTRPPLSRFADGWRWGHLSLACAAGVVAFGAAMPHAFLDSARFLDDQNEERRKLITGQDDVPFTRQYAGTVPFVFYFENLVRWTQFYPLGIVSLAALVFGAARALGQTLSVVRGRPIDEEASRARSRAVLVAWCVGYLAVVGTSYAKFNRYLLPVTPILAVLAAEWIARLASGAFARAAGIADPRRAVAFAVAAVWIPTLAYAIGFVSIYRRPHPWIAASIWMQEHQPPSTPRGRQPVVLNEEWGDDLPIPVGGRWHSFATIRWAVQEPDSLRKLDELARVLSQADLVAWADRRAYGTYLRLPKRYPLNHAYYSTMLAHPERLGFRRAKEFTSYPHFLGLPLRDDWADESFTLFDHPHVYLFEKMRPIAPDEIRSLLAPALPGPS